MPGIWRRSAASGGGAATLDDVDSDGVRPMTEDDVDGVVAMARLAYAEPETDFLASGGVTPWTERKRDAGSRLTAKKLVRHLIRTDPATCFVIDRDGTICGAIALTDREDLCGVALFAVDTAPAGGLPDGGPPSRADHEELAIRLYRRVKHTVEDSSRAMAVTSVEPHSIRALFRWGFDVHPAMRAEGAVDRSALPVTPLVRDGVEQDLDLCQAVDRRLRGAARGPDHALLHAGSRLLVAESASAKGYAYVRPNGSPLTVAATQTSLARELLAAALGSSEAAGVVGVPNLTGEQRWAFDVVRTLGLDLHVSGPVLVRGMALPSPYLPHDALC